MSNLKKFLGKKSLLAYALAVIFLCVFAAAFVSFGKKGDRGAIEARADGEPVYAAYLRRGGNGALRQLPARQESTVYLGSYHGAPVRWYVLAQGTGNNDQGTMLYSYDKEVLPKREYQFFTMNSFADLINLWASSYLRASLNGTPYIRNFSNSQIMEWNGESLTDEIFGTSGAIRSNLLPTSNNTEIYKYDHGNKKFTASASHIGNTVFNRLQSDPRFKAYFEDYYEFTEDYLFPLKPRDHSFANGFTYMDEFGVPAPDPPAIYGGYDDGLTVYNDTRFFVHDERQRLGNTGLRNAVSGDPSQSGIAAQACINFTGSFESTTETNNLQQRLAFNYNHGGVTFAVSGSYEDQWLNGTVPSSQGNRPAYKLFLSGDPAVGNITYAVPSSALVVDGDLRINLNSIDTNNYIDKYMLVVKDELGNVVSSRGVDPADYSLSGVPLDPSVVENGGIKSGYTLSVFGYKSTEGNATAYCTDVKTVQLKNKKSINLSLVGVTDGQLPSAVYGDPNSVGVVISVNSGFPPSGYTYTLQYCDEIVGEWITGLPTDVGRYRVVAYGEETEEYAEALSESALLVITPRKLSVNFVDVHNVSPGYGERSYNGHPYVINAIFSNLVGGDSFTPIISGAGEINASPDDESKYHAFVSDFTPAEPLSRKENYELPENLYEYLITRRTTALQWNGTSLPYNKGEQCAVPVWNDEVPLQSGCSVVATGGGTNVGTYTATASITGVDAGNYIVVNPTQQFEIIKAFAPIVWVDLNQVYSGGQKEPTVGWDDMDTYPDELPRVVEQTMVSAGIYTVTAVYNGEDKDNYILTNDTETFIIQKYAATVTLSGDAVYGKAANIHTALQSSVGLQPGQELFLKSQMEEHIEFDTNWTTTSPVSGTYYVYVKGHNQPVYKDTATLNDFEVTYMRGIVIASKDVVIAIDWCDDDFTYNGDEQTVTAVGQLGSGLQVGLAVTVDRVFKDAGSYTATAALPDTDNYSMDGSLTTVKAYTMKRAAATAEWNYPSSVSYDGTQKDPAVGWRHSSVIPQGLLTVNSETRVNAGTYTVSAVYDGADADNFDVTCEDFVLEILRVALQAHLHGSAIYGQPAVLSYTVSGVVVAGEENLVKAALDSVTLATDWTTSSPAGGTYKVYVDGHDEEIYIDNDSLANYRVEWVRGSFDVTTKKIINILWCADDFTYTGTVQTVTATGEAEDGTSVDIDISVNKPFKDAADDYVATASLSVTNAQSYYFDTGVSTTHNYTIKRAAATVVWSGLTATYDGTQKDPSAAWASSSVVPTELPTVDGGARINVGEYPVTAAYNGADKDNFTVHGAENVFTITKATVAVTVVLVNSSITFGENYEANIGVTWAIPDDSSNEASLKALLSGYERLGDVGTYTITLDFGKAEDESRRSAETFLDNYVITVTPATLVVAPASLHSFSIRAINWTYGDEPRLPEVNVTGIENTELPAYTIKWSVYGDYINETDFSAEQPKKAGEYFVWAETVAGNYYQHVSSRKKLTVSKAQLYVYGADTEVEYRKAAKYAYTASGFKYDDGDDPAIKARIEASFTSDYTVGAKAGETFEVIFSGGIELDDYRVTGRGATLTVVKTRVSSLYLTGVFYTGVYGNTVKPQVSVFPAIDGGEILSGVVQWYKDGEWVEWTETEFPKNVGSYRIRAYFGGTDNYLASGGDEKSITVMPKEAEVGFYASEFVTIVYGDDPEAVKRQFGVYFRGFEYGEYPTYDIILTCRDGSPYSATTPAGTEITVGLSVAEDRNYIVTCIDTVDGSVVEKTVNKKEITETEIKEWEYNGEISFDDKAVLEDGNIHNIYVTLTGDAAKIIRVSGYTVDGTAFSGASAAGNYYVVANIEATDPNYETTTGAPSALLRIYRKILIKDGDGNDRGYVYGLDPDHDYTAILSEGRTDLYSEIRGKNVETTIGITDENGDSVTEKGLTFVLTPPSGYDMEKHLIYGITGGGPRIFGEGEYTVNPDGGEITVIADAESGIAKFLFSRSGAALEGIRMIGFWIIIAGATLFGFIVILIFVKKLRDGYSAK